VIAQAAILIFVYFTLWYIAAAVVKNASIIDIGWGLGFVMVAIAGFIKNITFASAVITFLIAVWGLRLSYHIFKRNFKKPEDFRYANFRKEWGRTYYIRSFFQLFMFQGVMMLIISLAFIYAIDKGVVNYPVFFYIGIGVWLIGFIFEAVSDAQLRKFKSDKANKGKLIDTGLWRYSRHPNYFGEALLWWGVFAAAIACSAPWYVIISPITITILVRFVSGVPMLEENLKKREGYEKYIETTSIFIPWFKKGGKNE